MSDRHTWPVQPFTPDNPPKYLVVWTEDLLLNLEASTEKRGYIVEKKQVTVFYNPELPLGLFHLTMTHVVDHISYQLGLEARYLAPEESRPVRRKAQPWTFGGCDLIAPNMVGDPEDFDCDDGDDL
jgi:hypothetical protein